MIGQQAFSTKWNMNGWMGGCCISTFYNTELNPGGLITKAFYSNLMISYDNDL